MLIDFGLIENIVAGQLMILHTKTMTVVHGPVGRRCCTIMKKTFSITLSSSFSILAGQV